MAWVVEEPELGEHGFGFLFELRFDAGANHSDLVIWNLPRPQSESQWGTSGAGRMDARPAAPKHPCRNPSRRGSRRACRAPRPERDVRRSRPALRIKQLLARFPLASSFFCCDSGSSGPGLGRLEGSRLTNPRAFPAFTASLRVARSTFGRGLGTIVSGSSMPSPKPYFPLMTTPLSREPRIRDRA